MGSQLTMETIREMDLADPGWPTRSLGGVILISPDINVDLFRMIVKGLSDVSQPLLILASSRDAALRLYAGISSSTDRLGLIEDFTRISNLPVEIIDVADFSNTAESSHFIPATSPAPITLMNDVRSVNSSFIGDNRLARLQLPPGGSIKVIDDARVVEVVPIEDWT
ncbi:MAG: alpha/beta hydrolase [Rhodobacteraceae bacterium]|nr:alpha/beta hydrolase [Paracoccaceae bacterium]